jgi:hypothetical protein
MLCCLRGSIVVALLIAEITAVVHLVEWVIASSFVKDLVVGIVLGNEIPKRDLIGIVELGIGVDNNGVFHTSFRSSSIAAISQLRAVVV